MSNVSLQSLLRRNTTNGIASMLQRPSASMVQFLKTPATITKSQDAVNFPADTDNIRPLPTNDAQFFSYAPSRPYLPPHSGVSVYPTEPWNGNVIGGPGVHNGPDVLGDIDKDIPPANPNSDPRFPNEIPPQASRDDPGVTPWYPRNYNGPVFSPGYLGGWFPSAGLNVTGYGTNSPSGTYAPGGGPTAVPTYWSHGTGYDTGPSGFAGLFGAPVGQVAPSAAALASMFPYARAI